MSARARGARLAAALVGMLLAAVTVDAQQTIGVAARVNGVEISQRALQKSLDDRLERSGGVGNIRRPERYRELQRGVLDSLIEQELIWQAARKAGKVAADADVEAEMAGIRAGFESEAMYRTRLRIREITEDELREAVRRRQTITGYIEHDVYAAITIDDREVEAFYREHAESFRRPEQVRARHILIQVPQDADAPARTAARERAADLTARARAGADFAALAREHSQDSSAPQGGDLGWFTRGRMVAPFDQAAFALAPGEIAGPVETVFGFHVIQVEQRRPESVLDLADAAPRIREHLLTERRAESLRAHIDALREQGTVEIFADL